MRIKEEKVATTIDVYERFDAYPLDGAHALGEVLQRRYDKAEAITETFEGFLGMTFTQKPTTTSLETGFGETKQVIWGTFRIKAIGGKLATGASREKNGQLIFVLSGEIEKNYQDELNELVADVRAYLKENSVYRGAAIKIITDDDGDLNTSSPPKFLDLSRVNQSELAFSDELMQSIETNLFTPIKYSDRCRKHGMPLKRGILLEGKYGTGKTLTAYVTAKIASENNWTFIYLDRVSSLKSAILFARQYQPAVIFAEDIDREIGGEDRTVRMDDVLNHIDGIDSKNQELIVILTTNEVAKINKAMLRPGRLDTIITTRPPDAAAAERLVRLYSRGLLCENENLAEVGRTMDGMIPAMIREVVERAKLTLIPESETIKLTARTLLKAAKEIKEHLELIEPATIELQRTKEEALGVAFKELLGLNGHGKMIEALCDYHDIDTVSAT